MGSIILDADDFCESNAKLDVLFRLKEANPILQINLFTIPALCSPAWLKEIKKIEWIEMIPHGWEHPHSRECENWSYGDAMAYLEDIRHMGLSHGFKAPGWQISDGTYLALLQSGYWVADQHYNDDRRPKGLEVRYPEEHFHIGHLGGHNDNEIEDHFDYIASLEGPFTLYRDL